MKFKKKFYGATKYLSETRNYILFAFALFVLGAIISFALPGYFTFFDSLLKDLSKQVQGLSGPELIWFIFKNNVGTAFFGLILGMFFGIFPIVNALTNGALVGYVFSRAYDVAGGLVILKLVPHGIFELPAIFISLGLGLRIGLTPWHYYRTKSHLGFWKILVYRLKKSLLIFVLFVVPLLIIAAIIEGTLITGF